jgi:hypothetical protein
MAVSARFENLASWFAASVLVTAGVIYALKLEDDRPRSHHIVIPPRATPAQEPPILQQRRATELGRGRHAHRIGRCGFPGVGGRTSSFVPIVKFRTTACWRSRPA